jgi:respiratory nitrate reductase gamma subunit
VASLSLHWGLGLLFLGHLAGFLGGLVGAGGWVAAFYWLGLIGGLLALFGSGLALWRRHRCAEVRAMSRWDDYVVHWFLLLILSLGLYQVLVDRIFGVAYTASSWLASVLALAPQPALMDSSSFVSKLHVLLAFTFFAVFPFTKLVHAWTYPWNYAVRPYQSMRTDQRINRRGWEWGLRTDKSFLLYGAVGLALFFGLSSWALLGRTGPGVAQAQDAAQDAAQGGALSGHALYVSQCARCHGLDGGGAGEGAGSPTFAQPPRDLQAGRYHFVSTSNGVASDDDLARTIRRGLVPAGMPAFPALSEAQVRSLVEVVRGLARSPARMGEPIVVPPRPAGASVEEGRTLWQRNCVTCHGERGAGDGPAAKGLRVPAANLAAGALKAGATDADLYWRITAGIIPAGMAPFGAAMSEQQRWSLIAFLRQEILPRGGAAP